MNIKNNNDLKTLSQCITHLRNKGYKKDFQVTADGLKAMDMDKLYQPDEVTIDAFYRFEGASDPADMSILYAMSATDGTKGTLSDAFGPYASGKVSEFLEHVEAIQKKNNSKDWWKFWN